MSVPMPRTRHPRGAVLRRTVSRRWPSRSGTKPARRSCSPSHSSEQAPGPRKHPTRQPARSSPEPTPLPPGGGRGCTHCRRQRVRLGRPPRPSPAVSVLEEPSAPSPCRSPVPSLPGHHADVRPQHAADAMRANPLWGPERHSRCSPAFALVLPEALWTPRATPWRPPRSPACPLVPRRPSPSGQSQNRNPGRGHGHRTRFSAEGFGQPDSTLRPDAQPRLPWNQSPRELWQKVFACDTAGWGLGTHRTASPPRVGSTVTGQVAESSVFQCGGAKIYVPEEISS